MKESDMNRSGFRPVMLTLLIVAAAAAIAIGAYNAGVAHGIAEGGRAVVAPAPGPGGVPYVYAWPHPWRFGFPFFPFFGLLLLFFAVRGLFWHGPWRAAAWGYGYRGVPPAFEEWHRRAHAQETPQPPPSDRA
jgi:hypothetical protein